MSLYLRKRLGGLAAAILLASIGVTTIATSANAHTAPAQPPTPLAAELTNIPIRNVESNLCLQPENGSTDHFAAIVQNTCNGSVPQRWTAIRVGTNHYHFLNQNSGLCLWAWDGARNNGRVLLDDCNGASNSEFNTSATLPSVVRLESRVGFRDTGFCVDVPQGQHTPGVRVQIFRCNGQFAQRWAVG
jgi:hypothetical protein